MTAAGAVTVRVRCPSPEATRALGAALAAALQPGDVVLLSGELGAGKTTLAQGLVASLGGELATSPSYTLCQVYDTVPVVAHADCWRLVNLDEVVELALDEVLDDGGVVLVEWGELAAPLLGAGALRIALAAPGGGEASAIELGRLAELVATSGTWPGRLERLAARLADLGLETTEQEREA